MCLKKNFEKAKELPAEINGYFFHLQLHEKCDQYLPDDF